MEEPKYVYFAKAVDELYNDFVKDYPDAYDSVYSNKFDLAGSIKEYIKFTNDRFEELSPEELKSLIIRLVLVYIEKTKDWDVVFIENRGD